MEKKKKGILPHIPNISSLVQKKITLVKSDAMVNLSEKKTKEKINATKSYAKVTK